MADHTSHWHDSVFFGIHYDLHANARDTALGAGLTLDNLRTELGKVKPDWIQIDCKGHPGWTSWPTKVGSTSPGVVQDSVALHSQVCRELGIKLGMHYSGVIDRRALELHPEWAAVSADGQPSDQSTCRLSAYRDALMIPQLLELIDTYDVDGFWVDGENWATAPCYCERCAAEFARRTGQATLPRRADEPGWDAWLAFHRDLFIEHVTAYTAAVHARKPACAVCSNWMYTLRQPEPVAAPIDYLSGDYMPNFGAYRAALEARFMAHRGRSWDLMCWGFTKGAQHRTSVWKTAVHLCQEVTEVLAQGGAVMIYGKPQRAGHLISWHHDILAEVAEFCRARRPWSFATATASQVAVLHLASHYYHQNQPSFNYGAACEPLEGALHALLETHHSADLLAEETILARLEQYPLVVVPEQTHLSPALVAALTAHAERGATILLTGAHLAAEQPELVGCTPSGGEVRDGRQAGDAWGALFLEHRGEAIGIQAPWAVVEPAAAEVLVRGLTDSEPGKDQSELPAITGRAVGQGRIVAIHGPVFREYYQTHCPRLRSFLKALVAGFGIPWEVRLDGPPQLELVVRRQGETLLCHLLNRGVGEMTYPQRVIVESVPPVRDVTLSVRRAAAPEQVMLQPAGTPLAWVRDGEQIRIAIPEITIHDIVEIA